jgi:hypothetical protein
VHGEAGVDHLVDEQDVAAADLDVEVLQEADPLVAAELAAALAGELHEVERVRDRDRAREVGDERHARLQRADEERLAAGVVAGELGAELAHARRDLGGVEVDRSDSLVADAQRGVTGVLTRPSGGRSERRSARSRVRRTA